MKIGVVVFPGSNCDADTLFAFGQLTGQRPRLIWHKDTEVGNVDLVVLPGGFSYGDYLRSGAIARFSPVMDAVARHVNRGGLLLGICNGFQILTEARLVPGVLRHNTSRRFVCRAIHIIPATSRTRLTQNLDPSRPLLIPIAHGEGNYYIDDEGHRALLDGDQVLFRYCGPEGELDNDWNPNGSLDHIAGVCNKERTVFGMMPHPERASDPLLGMTDGTQILASLLGLSPVGA
jgi:phosphoribosylformylglycinamidine synthase